MMPEGGWVDNERDDMTTAAQQRASNNQQTATQQTQQAQPLDRVLEQTTRQQSLAGDAARFLGVRADRLFDYLRNVWKTSKGQPPLTDQEMGVGIGLIARYELDPIAREVYVTRGKGGIFAIVSIDGWLKVLDRTDHYDGFTVEIHHDDHGQIDWVETAIHSTKRKHPAIYRAYAAEYARVAGMVAKDMPSHMLRIFSLRHAARLFAPLSASVTTEEEVRYIEQQAEAAEAPRVNRLDELTDRLMQPIAEQQTAEEELPETSYEPSTAAEPKSPADEAWNVFLQSLDACEQIGECQSAYDRAFGPDSTIEWSQEDDEIARTRVLQRQEEIRSSRGGRKS